MEDQWKGSESQAHSAGVSHPFQVDKAHCTRSPHTEDKVHNHPTRIRTCRVTGSCSGMKSDGNVSKCQDKAAFLGLVDFMRSPQGAGDCLYFIGCTLKSISSPKTLQITLKDLPFNCLSGTHSPVFHLQVRANWLTLRESYLWLVRATECVYSYPQSDST